MVHATTFANAQCVNKSTTLHPPPEKQKQQPTPTHNHDTNGQPASPSRRESLRVAGIFDGAVPAAGEYPPPGPRRRYPSDVQGLQAVWREGRAFSAGARSPSSRARTRRAFFGGCSDVAAAAGFGARLRRPCHRVGVLRHERRALGFAALLHAHVHHIISSLLFNVP